MHIPKQPLIFIDDFGQHGNLLLLSKNTKNTWKNEKTLAPGEINLQSKHYLICHAAKVKTATSAHSMADVIPFLACLLFPSNPTLRYNQKKICSTHNKDNNILTFFYALTRLLYRGPQRHQLYLNCYVLPS